MSNSDIMEVVPGEDINVGKIVLGGDIVPEGDIVLKGNIILEGNCVCNCGGNGNGGGGTGTVVENCPHPSWPFTGTAMADFAKTERCVAVETAGTGEIVDITNMAVDSGADMEPKAAAYSPDGQWFVAAGRRAPYAQLYKKQGAVWVLQQNLTPLEDHYYRAAAFSSDSQCLALGMAPGELRLYELVNGVWTEKTTLAEDVPSLYILDVQFSADGRWLACTCEITISLLEHGYYFILFKKEGADWVEHTRSQMRTQWSHDVSFTADSKFMCVVYGSGAPQNWTGFCEVYELEGDVWVKRALSGVPNLRSTVQVTFSQNNEWMFLGTTHFPDKLQNVWIYRYVGGEWVYQQDAGEIYGKICQFCSGMAALPDGKIVIILEDNHDTHDQTIYLLEQRDDKWEITSHIAINGEIDYLYKIAVSPDGKQLAMPISQEGFRIYSLGGDGGREIHPFTTVRDAAEMAGFVGLGFTHEAVRQGEQGVADIMFE